MPDIRTFIAPQAFAIMVLFWIRRPRSEPVQREDDPIWRVPLPKIERAYQIFLSLRDGDIRFRSRTHLLTSPGLMLRVLRKTGPVLSFLLRGYLKHLWNDLYWRLFQCYLCRDTKLNLFKRQSGYRVLAPKEAKRQQGLQRLTRSVYKEGSAVANVRRVPSEYRRAEL